MQNETCPICKGSGLRQVLERGHWERVGGVREFVVDDTVLPPYMLSHLEIDAQYPGYMEATAYCECFTKQRATRQIAQAEASANVPNNRTFDWIDFGDSPEAVAAVRQFARALPVTIGGVARNGLVLVGTTGTGKTSLAMLAFKRLSEAGYTCKFQEYTRLIEAVQRTYDNSYTGDSAYDVIDKLCNVPVLFIDDLGEKTPNGVEPASRDRAEIIYKVLGDREAKQKPTLITTNLNSDERVKHFGDRIASRINGMCHIIKLTGADRRKVK